MLKEQQGNDKNVADQVIASAVIKAIDKDEHKTINDLLFDIKNRIDKCCWSGGQGLFMNELQRGQGYSGKEALNFLHKKAALYFVGKEHPLVEFIFELKEEQNNLQKITTDLFDLLEKSNSSKNSDSKKIGKQIEQYLLYSIQISIYSGQASGHIHL